MVFHKGFRAGLLVLTFLIGLTGNNVLRADVVTNCTASALQAALAHGGLVTYTQACSAVFTNTIIITNAVTLDGGTNAITLSTSNAFRLFLLQPGAIFTIRNITLTGGRSIQGGAIYVDAGSTLTVSNCTFSGNRSLGSSGIDGEDGSDGTNAGGNGKNAEDGTPGLGGAIYNLGSLTILNSLFLT